MVRQRATATQSSVATVLCVALLKPWLCVFHLKGHRETAVISHVQNSTRLQDWVCIWWQFIFYAFIWCLPIRWFYV